MGTKRKKCITLLLTAAVLVCCGTNTTLAAVSYQDTWIFRSAVAPGQSMWGPGSHTGYNFNDTYEYQAGIFKAGFEWNLQADQGTAFGNVEGNITAQYDKFVNKLGKTTINLSYAGIENESQIGTSLGVELSGKPYIGIDLPWPIPDINVDIPVKMIDIDLDSKKDFTTGLDATVSDSGQYDILPFNVDAGIVSGDLNFFLDNDISFTPKTITGIMKYTHLETQIEKETKVTFGTDTDLLALDVDLDLPGAWEFSLEDFIVSENTFTQELDLGLEFAVGIPLLSVEFAAEIDSIFDFGERNFALDFLNHGYDGNPETADRLGRFCVYVTPEPTTLVLFGFGGLLLRRNKK